MKKSINPNNIDYESLDNNENKKINVQKDKVGWRKWLVFILVGFAGQMAWNVENMYLSKFLFYLGYSNYHLMTTITVIVSAIIAFLATFIMGALTDKLNRRKIFISVGYILWGISTAAFGLIDVNNVHALFPLANAGLVASIFVIIIDALMTFIGSTANDASFNSYVTREVSDSNRGKVEGVLSILPLIAMLLIFGVLDAPLAQEGKWLEFFFIIGGIALVVGIVSLFLIPKEKHVKEEAKNSKDSYFKTLISGFKISTIKQNKLLYLNLISYLIFGIATQVFFSYMIVYFQESLELTGTTFTIVMGLVLIVGSTLTVLAGFLMDKVGKNVMLIPTMVTLFVGCLLIYFLNKNSSIYLIICGGIIMIFGYIFGGTVLNAIVRDKVPNSKEGVFMGVRMLFAITLPMVIGSLISNYLIDTFYTDTYIDTSTNEVLKLPPAIIWLVGGIIALLAIIPIIIYLIYDKKDRNNKRLNNTKNNGLTSNQDVSMYKFDENNIPLKEHPNPYFRRDKYLSLNGIYDIEISKNEEFPKEYKDKILLPFSIESPLGGLNRLVEPDDIIYYHKVISIDPSLIDESVILNLLGVDQEVEVYVNNVLVATNNSGYTSFKVNIKEHISSDNSFDLILKVKDKTDNSPFSRGKQSLLRGGIWYTSTSGVYKPIYLEFTKKDYIISSKIEGDASTFSLKGKIKTSSEGDVKIRFNNKDHYVKGNQDFLIKVDEVKLWSINEPNLYDLDLEFKGDIVHSYIGFRKIEIKKIDNKVRLFLNNKEILLKGVLDQGYYYGGNLTPASYDDYLKDILNLKKLGFNTIRKHIKYEIPMFYYYCDKEGMLVIQDMINGGDKYDNKVVASPKAFLSKTNNNIDKNHEMFARSNEQGREEYLKTSLFIVSSLSSSPSVIIYTLFNEGWGQFDSTTIYNYFKDKDDNHLYDTNSGWYDNTHSDFYSKHNYFLPIYNFKDKEDKRASLLSEFGGYSLYLKDHFYGKDKFGYRYYKSKKSLSKAYKKLLNKVTKNFLKKDGVGFIYTQLSDVEDELNGLYTFDREELKIDEKVLISTNKEVDNLLK